MQSMQFFFAACLLFQWASAVTLTSSLGQRGSQRDSSSPELLFIGIMSAPGNFARRQEIRQSWMTHHVMRNDSRVKAKFVIGQVGEHQESALQKEAAHYKDFVRLAVVEGYSNLTRKTLTFFKWSVLHHPATKFFMKLDDDTFPKMEALLPILAKKKPHYVYMGAMMGGGPVQRRGKWAEDPTIFPDEFYPTYAAGSGYILSMRLARKLHEADIQGGIRLLANEDTTVGVWIHNFADANPHLAVDFDGVAADVCGCTDGALLAMQLRPGELSCMWHKFQNAGKPGGGDCCRPLRCYGLHEVTPGDVLFWQTNPPPRCPEDTVDPAAAFLDELNKTGSILQASPHK